MNFKILSVFLLLGLLTQFDSYAQDRDTTSLKPVPLSDPTPAQRTAPKDSTRLAIEAMPRRAALKSAMLPGLGQIYNKRWWKVPLVYGGFVGIGFIYDWNQHYYQLFLKEAQFRSLNPSETENPMLVNYSTDGVTQLKDSFRRDRDLTILGAIGFYALNIIDAYIDAKFYRFDVSDDLALQVTPAVQPGLMSSAYARSPAIGFNVKLLINSSK